MVLRLKKRLSFRDEDSDDSLRSHCEGLRLTEVDSLPGSRKNELTQTLSSNDLSLNSSRIQPLPTAGSILFV